LRATADAGALFLCYNKDMKTKLYEYCQNTRDSALIENENIGNIVLIEAINSKHADLVAERLGLYFDKHINSSHTSYKNFCGVMDKWFRASEEFSFDTLGAWVDAQYQRTYNNLSARVHYLNGTKRQITIPAYYEI
jgi:hypothetical protein